MPRETGKLQLREGDYEYLCSLIKQRTIQAQVVIRVNSKEELETRIYQYFDEVNQEPIVYHWICKLDEVSDVEVANT